MIKKFNEFINESVWADIHKRSSGTQVKKEDEIGNLHKLKPIDMGGSVLWADVDLEYEGNSYFDFDEAQELISGSNWRLPMLGDIAELDNIPLHTISDSFVFITSDNSLVFNKKGFIYINAGLPDQITDDDFYYGWTSETYRTDGVHIFTFDNNTLIHTPLDSNRVIDQVLQRKQDKLCVRLVKDK